MMIIQEAELIPFYSHCQKYLCIYFYHRGWAILKLQKEKHCLTSYKGTSRCNNNNEKRLTTTIRHNPFLRCVFWSEEDYNQGQYFCGQDKTILKGIFIK